MSKLIDGYTQIISALEEWIYVVQKKMETDSNPSYALIFHNLSILILSHQTIIPEVEELERVLHSLGLELLTVDTTNLDALWGNDDSPVEGASL